MYSSVASDFYENKKRKLELRDDVCFVLAKRGTDVRLVIRLSIRLLHSEAGKG